jgi:two-component sensor histidine kinase
MLVVRQEAAQNGGPAMRLADDLAATVQARQYARLWGAQIGVDGPAVAELELVVDELVSNAVLHAAPPYELHLFHVNGVIRGQVRDGSNVAPSVDTEADNWGGFGLQVVTDTTSRWGTTPLQVGKEIWFEIRL